MYDHFDIYFYHHHINLSIRTACASITATDKTKQRRPCSVSVMYTTCSLLEFISCFLHSILLSNYPSITVIIVKLIRIHTGSNARGSWGIKESGGMETDQLARIDTVTDAKVLSSTNGPLCEGDSILVCMLCFAMPCRAIVSLTRSLAHSQAVNGVNVAGRPHSYILDTIKSNENEVELLLLCRNVNGWSGLLYLYCVIYRVGSH